MAVASWTIPNGQVPTEWINDLVQVAKTVPCVGYKDLRISIRAERLGNPLEKSLSTKGRTKDDDDDKM